MKRDPQSVRERMDILYEDNHVIAVMKPPGVPSQSDRTGDPCIIDLVKDLIKVRDKKPGDVFIAAAHRLDRPASGVLALAKTSKSASRLSMSFREGLVKKTYLVVVEGRPNRDENRLTDFLLKDPALNTSRVVAGSTKGAKSAALSYSLLAHARGFSLLRVNLETGRSHQIRAQFASIGIPVAGDRRYGAKTALGPMIALHSLELTFPHPTRKKDVTVRAALPDQWSEIFSPELLDAANAEVCVERTARLGKQV